MKFFSRSDLPPRVFNKTGSESDITYGVSFDEHDIEVLKKTGRNDRFAKTQMYRDICSVPALVARCVRGDNTAIPEKSWSDSDRTFVPQDLVSLFSLEKEITQKFNNLPAVVREKYGNSLTAFASAVTSGQIYKDFPKKEEKTIE